jgi:hypothetical protein
MCQTTLVHILEHAAAQSNCADCGAMQRKAERDILAFEQDRASRVDEDVCIYAAIQSYNVRSEIVWYYATLCGVDRQLSTEFILK